jgi:hypothetical protein
VIPVARKVWQPILTFMPSSAARRRIMRQASTRCIAVAASVPVRRTAERQTYESPITVPTIDAVSLKKRSAASIYGFVWWRHRKQETIPRGVRMVRLPCGGRLTPTCLRRRQHGRDVHARRVVPEVRPRPTSETCHYSTGGRKAGNWTLNTEP